MLCTIKRLGAQHAVYADGIGFTGVFGSWNFCFVSILCNKWRLDLLGEIEND